ncbi:uncharacterized protein LOC126816579 [Patella vulgata]|uniref:uncharacterized protein LOC126816579 n=1 Tax=Patella vulgata TaxID=6465 RepID=UPI0024A86387|nr:uncharacterized protein LOC126816579 [Patella vulgata]
MSNQQLIRRTLLSLYKVQPRRLSTMPTSVNHSFKLTFEGCLGIVNLGEGEKRFSNDFMQSFHSILDQVESNKSCKALVTTAEGKFYSNGLDVDYIDKQTVEAKLEYLKHVRNLLQRVLTFPMPTIAALNGHTFAAGGFLAISHDFRLMTNGRGWISWNEIFIHRRFTSFLLELMRNKLTAGQARNQALIFGKRFTAEEAKDCGIVDAVTEPANVLSESMQFINSVVANKNYDRDFMKVMKSDVYSQVLHASYDYVKSPL